MTARLTASVVRDRDGRTFFVAAPRAVLAAVRAIDGTSYDGLIDRYLVPVAREVELREVLAAVPTSWAVDHRAAQDEARRHRCAVCHHPLAAVLVAQGQRTHWACRLPAAKRAEPERAEALW